MPRVVGVVGEVGWAFRVPGSPRLALGALPLPTEVRHQLDDDHRVSVCQG